MPANVIARAVSSVVVTDCAVAVGTSLTGVTVTLSVAAAPYVIHMIPLLVESGQWRKRVDRVLVVDCPPETQIVRVMRRSQLSRDDVLAIMARQVTRAARLAVADDVIDNYGELEMTVDDQVRVLHQRYLYLAGSPAVGP